jgi:hypothetical protein
LADISGTGSSIGVTIIIDRMMQQFPGRDMKQIGKKMTLNALIAPVQISITFTTVTLLAGKHIVDAQKKISKDLGPTWMAGAVYWPLIGFSNFRFVPTEYRAVTGSLAGVIWNVYLSNKANLNQTSKEQVITPPSSSSLP